MQPLTNIRVVSLAVNLPGPLAVARLHQLGAAVVKVEPPDGDPLGRANPDWYRALHKGQEVFRLDLKAEEDRMRLQGWLGQADVLVTATRPRALQRLGLAWADLTAAYPRLCQVAIVGYPAPRDDVPGHDLTYQAHLGLVVPPHLPRVCTADLAGAQEAVSAALGLLLARERGQGSGFAAVSLAAAAEWSAEPLRHGLTAPGGVLGGGFPGYQLYRAREGWVAVAALEPHFFQKLAMELGVSTPTKEEFGQAFLGRTATQWAAWAAERDLPLVEVREAPTA
jgi:crotonobetainyl-CoA:carnitine CoA-transferase CaiB-like acyl-CoA transferase